MTFIKTTVIVLIAVLFLAGSLWGADAGSSPKWGLWGDPQQDVLDSGADEPPPPQQKKRRSVKEEPPAPQPAQPENQKRTEAAGNEANRPADQSGGNQAAVDEDYLIGPGDQLDVSVWKDEALVRTLTVLPEGKVTFPLIGEVVVAGKTVGQIKKEFETKLAKFMPDPVVSIEVKQVNSQLVYVLGRVNTPGRFVLNSNVTVLQALALAGGCNPFANRNDIKIIRNDGDTTRVIHFNYDDVVKEEFMEENIRLKRGDVIVVP